LDKQVFSQIPPKRGGLNGEPKKGQIVHIKWTRMTKVKAQISNECQMTNALK
jgi:hypothetical protein